MVLFIIQLVRLVTIVLLVWTENTTASDAYPLISSIHEVTNVGIRSHIFTFYDNVWLGYNAYNHPSEGVNGILFPRWEFHDGSRWEFVLCACQRLGGNWK